MQAMQNAVAQESDKRVVATTIAVNGRYRAHKVAGQQRYANELIRRMAPHLQVIEPEQPLKGVRGHCWEQFVLPLSLMGNMLWSPCQAGPVSTRRQVVTFHDLFALDNPEWFSASYAWWYRQIIPRLAQNASQLIAVSNYTKRRLVSLLGVSESKIHVIHSGIAPEFQPQSPDCVAGMRQQLSLPSPNYLLCVSSLEPRKNLSRIIEAWKQVLPELPPDCWLVLAGAKGNSGVFADSAFDPTVSRVHLTGYVDDALLPALYAGANAFLYPSLAEGFGFPVLEAMACGTPSLTANSSSLPEVTGNAALHVNPLNVTDIAQGILTLVFGHSLREELRGRGLRRVRAFDWDRAASHTLQVLQAANAPL